MKAPQQRGQNELSPSSYFPSLSSPPPPSSSLERQNYQQESIENSPAARGLAEYFNRGGVRGITALDFGFSYEPSLFQDSVFEEQLRPHEGEEKFAVHPDRFALSCQFFSLPFPCLIFCTKHELFRHGTMAHSAAVTIISLCSRSCGDFSSRRARSSLSNNEHQLYPEDGCVRVDCRWCIKRQ